MFLNYEGGWFNILFVYVYTYFKGIIKIKA